MNETLKLAGYIECQLCKGKGYFVQFPMPPQKCQVCCGVGMVKNWLTTYPNKFK